MKQRQYTDLQKEVLKIISRIQNVSSNPNQIEQEFERIRKDYKIEKPYLTLRQYINYHSCGSYNTFHFKIHDKEISIDSLLDMLTDELCTLYPLTNNFYVVDTKTESNNGDCESYHSDTYLTLEIKED